MTDPADKETLEGFLDTYSASPDGVTVIEVGDDVSAWPLVVFKFANTALVIQACGLGATDSDGPHLSIAAHAFHSGRPARIATYLTEDGKRYQIAEVPETPGTSHRWPAARGATLLVGDQR